jgi:hypothetical protein
VTGQAFAWAIVTGPDVSSTADPVKGGDVAGAPDSSRLPLGVQVTRAIATVMAEIRASLTAEPSPHDRSQCCYTLRCRLVLLEPHQMLAFALVRPDELERRLEERLDSLGPAPRAELLHVLMLPDFERADWIGEFWSYPESRVERGEGQCLRLPRRSFQDEVDDRERSDYYGDDDDDPDADGSDHPTTLATISPLRACAKP